MSDKDYNIIIPIHSKHAKNIYTGAKKYEYRKVAPSKSINNLILYETKPVCAITGIVKVDSIWEGSPYQIWKISHDYAGISHESYTTYYKNKNIAIAYQLGNAIKLKKSVSLSEIGVNHVPQSFQYVDNSILTKFII